MNSNDDRSLVFCFIAAMVVLLIVAVSLMNNRACAHDHEHPELDEWYSTLKMPDNPAVSCCGKADAYWCDTIHVRKGKTYCTITDDRDDAPLGRRHVELGTEIEIPNNKLKWDRGNPTGHAVVFLAVYAPDFVLCFVQNGGT